MAGTPPGGSAWILPGQRAAVYEQLGRQLASGLPLSTALRNVARGPAPKAIATALAEARAVVEAGDPLSSALERHPGAFPAHDVGFLGAAELAGALPIACKRLADEYRERQRRTLELGSKLLYPAGLMFASVVLLPLPLVFSAGWGAYVAAVLPGLVVFFAVAAGVAWLSFAPAARQARTALAHSVWKLPWVGERMRAMQLARTVRLLAACFGAGLTPAACFRAAARAAYDPALVAACLAVANRLDKGGQSVAMALAASSKTFPAELRQIVETGEEAGELDTALDRAAEEWEHRAQLTLAMLFGAARWAVMVGVFGFMGWHIIADSLAAMAPVKEMLDQP